MANRKAPPLTPDRTAELATARKVLNEAERRTEHAVKDLHAAITAAREHDGATWQAVAEAAGFNSVQAIRYWHEARN